MVYINEWLPNPVGQDAGGEFIELYNNGAADISLAGWRIGVGTATTTAAGEVIAPAKTKPASIAKFTIPTHGYLVLKREQDGLSLKNTDGALLLYGPDGRVADKAAFRGAAPEGRSYSRVDGGASPGKYFIFTDPTAGAPNAAFGGSIAVAHYPAGVPLGPTPVVPVAISVAASAIGLGLFLAAIITYVIKKNENLSHLFFRGDEAARGGVFETVFHRTSQK